MTPDPAVRIAEIKERLHDAHSFHSDHRITCVYCTGGSVGDLAFLLAQVETLTQALSAATERYNVCEANVNAHLKECKIQQVAQLQAKLTRAEQALTAAKMGLLALDPLQGRVTTNEAMTLIDAWLTAYRTGRGG